MPVSAFFLSRIKSTPPRAPRESRSLGVRIDPGPACQGFVTNVKGVPDRIAQAIKLAVKDGDESEKENGRVLLEKIENFKSGGLPVTIIIQDPRGNSMLVSDKAEKRQSWLMNRIRAGTKGPGFFLFCSGEILI